MAIRMGWNAAGALYGEQDNSRNYEDNGENYEVAV
jgi:hypothetical protein